MNKVMIHPAEYDTLRPAIDRAFELFPIPVKGKRVLIKPNVLRASEPHEGIVTHPDLLRAVVDKVETLKPAGIVVGDNPGLFNYGANEESFKQTGLMEAAKGYYRNIGLESRKLEFNPDYMATISLSTAVLDADIIISLPKFKTHGLTVVTGAIKNSYGFLPGAQKARLHKLAGTPERFHELIVDVFKLRVPDLFIVDAVVGMEGNGPASPDLRDIGRVLASDNAVALDSVIAGMMGLDPGRLRFIEKANQAGLGEYESGAIDIIGNMDVIAGFKLPPLGGQAVMDNETIQDLLSSRSRFLPRIDTNLCTACGTCIDQCPVSALFMAGDIPEADPEVCITCFCCQEVCPEKAISVE